MKMITLTLISCLFCASLTAPPLPNVVIVTIESISPLEVLWNATCAVESNFNSMAIGDNHLKLKSYGIVQIRQSRLDDYYKQTGIRYTTTDMFCVEKAKEVFMFYATGRDLETISRCWNGGPRGMQKKSTIEYWKKVRLNL